MTVDVPPQQQQMLREIDHSHSHSSHGHHGHGHHHQHASKQSMIRPGYSNMPPPVSDERTATTFVVKLPNILRFAAPPRFRLSFFFIFLVLSRCSCTLQQQQMGSRECSIVGPILQDVRLKMHDKHKGGTLENTINGGRGRPVPSVDVPDEESGGDGRQQVQQHIIHAGKVSFVHVHFLVRRFFLYFFLP